MHIRPARPSYKVKQGTAIECLADIADDSYKGAAMNTKLALITTLVCTTSTAWADGPRQHRGFYLRMAAGPGFMSAKSSSPDVKISGPGGSFDIAIGGALTENLVLFGNIAIDTTENAEIEVNGNEINTDTNDEVAFVGVGPGIGYYFMPVNLYISGSVLATQVAISDDDDAPGTERGTGEGFGMAAMVGKEWWVSANWGLGLAGRFMFGLRMPDTGDTDYNAFGFGVMFSATYN